MDSLAVRFQSILIYLLPAALVTGPFFPDLFCVIVSIIFVVFSIKNKEWHYYTHPIFIIFLLWCTYLIIRSLLSSDPLLSLESSLFYFRFGFLPLSILYIIEKNSNFIKTFTWFFTITFFIVLFDGYLQYFSGYNILGYTVFYENYSEYGAGEAHRLSGFFGDELILGSYLARLLPIIFALFILQYSDSKSLVFLSMGLLISTDVLVYISGERSAFFYLILISFMIVLFIKKQRKIRIITLILSIIIIAIISLTNEKIKNRMISHTINQTNVASLFSNEDDQSEKNDLSALSKEKQEYLEKHSKTRAFLTGVLTAEEAGIVNSGKLVAFSWHHQRHYTSALKMFFDNPFFGVGPKLFRIKCKEEKYYVEYGCSTHPHNIYVQLLAETGLVGFFPVFCCFLFLSYIFLKMIFTTRNHTKNEDYIACLYIALLVTLWPAVPTGSIFNNWLSVIFYLPIGFILHKKSIFSKS